jgi:hypothetical protein
MSSDFKKYLNVYTFKCNLPGIEKEIEFKPITTGELKKLLVYANDDDPERIEDALDNLVKSCVVTEDFNIDDLYLQDRYYLLFEIRKKTKGETYKFEFKCPKCNSQNIEIIDLNNLKVVKLRDKESNNIVKLTDNLSIRMSNIIRGAQKEIYRKLRSLKKNDSQYNVDFSIYTISCGIVGIITPDGEDNDITLDDKKYLVENIPTGLYEKISDWYSDNNFGIIFEYDLKCKNCGYISEKSKIQMSDFFL